MIRFTFGVCAVWQGVCCCSSCKLDLTELNGCLKVNSSITSQVKGLHLHVTANISVLENESIGNRFCCIKSLDKTDNIIICVFLTSIWRTSSAVCVYVLPLLTSLRLLHLEFLPSVQPCMHVATNFPMSSFHCTTDYDPQEDNSHNRHHKHDLTLQQTAFRTQIVSGITYTQQL
jgi:hypothetical protein